MTEQFITVVLCRTEGPINLGNICRLCANLGITDLRLVAPVCALDSAQSRMFAHHAQGLLQTCRVYAQLATAVADCDWVLATTAQHRRDSLDRFDLAQVPAALQTRRPKQLAVVFGAESNGLSSEELRVCDAAVALQTPGPYPSYNLSHAAAITLYALCVHPHADQRSPPQAQGPATHAQIERLFSYWVETLQEAGYFRRASAARFAPKLRRLLGRWNMRPHDVHTVFGMLAHLRQALSARGDAQEKDLANTRNAVR